jgi:hypothetical protein
MGAGKLRVLAGCGAVAAGVAVLASACASQAPVPAAPAAAVVARAVPAVPATTVPVLGQMTFGRFPGTWDGLKALAVCEQWAGLRGQYVARVQAGTPFQLEQWFSSTAWRPAFVANSPIKNDPGYSAISTAFGLVSNGDAASIDTARMLDAACAAAD